MTNRRLWQVTPLQADGALAAQKRAVDAVQQSRKLLILRRIALCIEEGTVREAAHIGGRYIDMRVFGISRKHEN
jgi:hypothetical protein